MVANTAAYVVLHCFTSTLILGKCMYVCMIMFDDPSSL